MYHFDITERTTNIDALISEYENILSELGILSRLKKRFKNHVLLEQTIVQMPTIIEEKKLN